MTDVRLVNAVRELDPGTRALLDLSLRRAIPDEQVARVLAVDVSEIPRRRAHGIAELADKLEVPGPSELAMLLVALPHLPEAAWSVPKPARTLRRFPTRVPRAQRAGAYRRAAAAASPLVALAAVIAALLVSNGSEQHASGTLTGATGGGGHQGAGAAVASDARHGLPRGAEIASIESPTPADLRPSHARPRRARHAKHAAAHQASAHAHRTGGSRRGAAVHHHLRPHSQHSAPAPHPVAAAPAPPPSTPSGQPGSAQVVSVSHPSHGHARALGHGKPAPGKAVGHSDWPAQPGQNGEGAKVPPGLLKKG
jgi:hypothetical protein